MRPSTAATLALVLSASTAVQGASPPPEGGSIQALLNRYSARTNKAIPVDAIPSDLKTNGTAAVQVVGNTTVLVVPVVPVNETASVHNPKASTKIVKRTKAKKEEVVERRSFVVDSSVVEEPASTPAGPSPSVLAAAQEAIVILSSVPSELAVPVASSTEDVVSSTVRAARKVYNPAMAKHGKRKHLSSDSRRRWIWSNSVIQDGDEDVPSESDDVELSTPGSAAAHKTPSAALSPPSYSASRAVKIAVESAHSARSSSKSSASTSQSLSVSAAARKAHSASTSSVSASKSSHTSASRSARSASKSGSSAAEESSSKVAAARAARTSSHSSSSSSSERSHRPPRSKTTTTPSAAEQRTPRPPKPTSSALENPVVAQVAALQVQQKVHTTILASRINRASLRQQPTDVLLGEDEEDEELPYFSVEEDEEEFGFEY